MSSRSDAQNAIADVPVKLPSVLHSVGEGQNAEPVQTL